MEEAMMAEGTDGVAGAVARVANVSPCHDGSLHVGKAAADRATPGRRAQAFQRTVLRYGAWPLAVTKGVSRIPARVTGTAAAETASYDWAFDQASPTMRAEAAHRIPEKVLEMDIAA